jgi:hypothetical protein
VKNSIFNDTPKKRNQLEWFESLLSTEELSIPRIKKYAHSPPKAITDAQKNLLEIIGSFGSFLIIRAKGADMAREPKTK